MFMGRCPVMTGLKSELFYRLEGLSAMEKQSLEKLLGELAAGGRTVAEVLAQLKHWPSQMLPEPTWTIIGGCGPESRG